MQIQNKKATNVVIASNSIDTTKNYVLATNDYLANGGDNAFMLKTTLNRTNLNYKLRDAIIDYIKDHNPLIRKTDGRVTKMN
jgi:2',3'-cyclic-nucleotide 2'-phosphodiesterase (5'-nucleotidase family)